MPKTDKIYEEKEIKLKFQGIQNASRVKKVTFTPVFDPEHPSFDLSPVKATHKGGKASASFNAPLVPDEMDKYKLRFTAQVTYRGNPDDERDVPGKYLVHIKTGKVTLTSENNKDHKKAKFIVRGPKGSSTKRAKPSGVWEGKVPMGDWSIEDCAPFELVDPQAQTGRERTYQVKKNPYKAIFDGPGITDGEEYKQYVNLKTKNWTTEEPFGSELEFTVTGEEGLAQPGDIVHVKVEFANRTERSDPKPELKTTNVGSPEVSDDANTFTGKVKLAGSGKGKFKVVFGHAGGEKCTISIGTTPDTSDASVTFVTWRRIGYELMYPEFMEAEMNPHALGHDIHDTIKSAAADRLAPVFVEYELSKVHRFTKREARENVIAGDKCGHAGRDRMVFGGGLGSFPKAFEGGDTTRIGILMAEVTAGDLPNAYKSYNKTAASSPRTFGIGKGLMLQWAFKRNSGKWEADVANPENYKNGDGDYIHPGLETDGSPRKGKLADACFTWEDTKHVKVTLPTANANDPGNIVGNHSADKCKIKIKYSLKVANNVNGFKVADGRQVMCIKPGKNHGAIASTLCHELGHSMGMTIVSGRAKAPPGLDAPKNVDTGGLYYSEDVAFDGDGFRDLGQGPHCAHGVPNVAAADFDKERGTCIMFHCGGAADDRPNFCPTCTDYIKARKLVDLHKPWNARSAKDY